jgi:hypothetical protein
MVSHDPSARRSRAFRRLGIGRTADFLPWHSTIAPVPCAHRRYAHDSPDRLRASWRRRACLRRVDSRLRSTGASRTAATGKRAGQSPAGRRARDGHAITWSSTGSEAMLLARRASWWAVRRERHLPGRELRCRGKPMWLLLEGTRPSRDNCRHATGRVRTAGRAVSGYGACPPASGVQR